MVNTLAFSARVLTGRAARGRGTCRLSMQEPQLRSTPHLQGSPVVEVKTRRSVLLGLSIAAWAIGALGSDPAMAVEEEVKVYFGCGCFWHVQHEFVVAEEKILGRRNAQITALTGYAGGTEVGRDGKVCYHNMFGDSDYGSLGHSEAVELSIPPSKFGQVAQVYMNLFINGERADPQAS
eukprot:763116-Hanusia_phi.AAC.7